MAQNYRQWLADLLAGIRWARSTWGERLTLGYYALFADMTAEGARQANHARFTAQCHDDALAQIGDTRDIQRYYSDAPSTYRDRLRQSFALHSQDGTKQAVELALANYGFPGAVVYEDWQWHRPPQPWWSQGWIYFPPGTHSVVAGSATYNNGNTYNSGNLYSVAGITWAEVAGLRRLVKKHKRSGFIFREFIFQISGSAYGTGGTYGGGGTYGTGGTQAVIGAE
jgi:hypothetical protein